MATENKILMQNAREGLKGNWNVVMGASFLYILISMVVSSIPKSGTVISLILSGPFMLGFISFFLSFSRGNDVKVSQIFDGFNKFTKALGLYLLKALFVLLWSLLFIIPGIIASLSYSMAFYIMSDDDSIRPKDALKKSKKMMYGYKWKLFCLGLRFLGWIILSILTLGIGFLWIAPYMQVSMAKFYDDIKDKPITKEA